MTGETDPRDHLGLVDELSTALRDEADALEALIAQYGDAWWSANLIGPLRIRASQIRERLTRLGLGF